jgi:hypothetical protein
MLTTNYEAMAVRLMLEVQHQLPRPWTAYSSAGGNASANQFGVGVRRCIDYTQILINTKQLAH